MQAYRIKKAISSNKSIQLDGLPFSTGEVVEIIVLASAPQKTDDELVQALEGSVLVYDSPTEPVAEGDWDVLL